MISQKCPRCNSNRVRRGYRPTRFWSKIFFRYNLLCNACNWQFKGFAVPGTVTVKPNRKRKKQNPNDQSPDFPDPANGVVAEDNNEEQLENDVQMNLNKQTDDSANIVSGNRIRVRKKVRIRQS